MLKLTSLRSGVQHTALDGRVVVGGAAFCHIRVAGCPPQTVLVIARYDQGWIAHDVQAQVVRKNGEEPAQSSLIRNGDLWQIGSDEFQCEVTDESPDSNLSTAVDSECRVTISGHQGLPISHRFEKTVTIIGNALYCDLTFEEPRLQPQHYLIARVGGTWFLHSLIDSGGHDGRGGFFSVRNGEAVQVGRTQLEFHVVPRQEVPVAHRVNAPVQRTRQSAQAGPVMSPGATAGVGTNPNATVQISHDPNPGVRADPVVLRAAQDVLNKIKALHLRQQHRDSSLAGRIRRAKLWMALRSVESDFAANARIRAFNKLGRLLEQDSGDRTLLLTFVRMCDAAGFDDICFHALRLMSLRDPDDRMVTRALARICSHLGQSEPTYFDKAARYWRAVQKQSPDERAAIESTIRGIDARKTSKKYERPLLKGTK
ncbi:MAG: FHA domain-containing protein [Planctomycetaceae bacterium]